MSNYSQVGQDTAVVKHFDGLRGGYFVEVGAGDGVTYSNTYLLEKEYGWRGICVEPIPEQFDKLVRARGGKGRSFCVPNPLLDVSGREVSFRVCERSVCEHPSMLSGIEDYLDAHPEARDGRQITMITETLTEVLDRCEAPSTVDYLSLDTEGSELLILRGVDWARYSFRLIHVEHNYMEPARTHIREFLESKGCRFVRELDWDDEYALGE